MGNIEITQDLKEKNKVEVKLREDQSYLRNPKAFWNFNNYERILEGLKKIGKQKDNITVNDCKETKGLLYALSKFRGLINIRDLITDEFDWKPDVKGKLERYDIRIENYTAFFNIKFLKNETDIYISTESRVRGGELIKDLNKNPICGVFEIDRNSNYSFNRESLLIYLENKKAKVQKPDIFERFKEALKINNIEEPIERINHRKRFAIFVRRLYRNNKQLQKDIKILQKKYLKYKERYQELSKLQREPINLTLDETFIKTIISQKTNGNEKKGYTLQYFYENMLNSSLGRMPEIEWKDNEIENKKIYQEIVGKLEKDRRLIVLFYKSKDWKQKRVEILRRDDFVCQICKKGGIKSEVHHINSAIYNPGIALDNDNLITICRKCHTHNYNNKNKEVSEDDL